MTYYLYLSHTGNYYIIREELSDEDNYCYECGDSDELIGEFKNKRELTKLLKAGNANSETIKHIVMEWEQDFIKK